MSNHIKKLQRLVNNGTIVLGNRPMVDYSHEKDCKITPNDENCTCDPKIEVREATDAEYLEYMSTIEGIDVYGINGEKKTSTEMN